MNRDRLHLRETGAIFRNGAFFRNPVLVGALGLYPAAAGAFGLKNAAVLALLFALTAFPSQILMCLFGMFLPKWARPAAALLATAACFLPASAAARALMPRTVAGLGLTAGLTACNSVLYSRAAEYAPEHILPAVVADAAGCSVGFAGAVCAVASLRELWTAGGLFGMGSGGAGAGGDLPFAGFVLMGFLAAAVRWADIRRSRRGVLPPSGRAG